MANISIADARRIWANNQELGRGGTAADVPGGWVRSLGGVDPYFAFWNRCPKATRDRVDKLLADDDLWVVPGVRGCIWTVPARDVPLALRVADASFRRSTTRVLDKLGVDAAERKMLEKEVLDLVEQGPHTPDQIRDALGDKVRSLGEPGKKKGHSTPLPAILRLLEGHGKVRRRQEGGGLDSNRYVWECPDKSPYLLGEDPGEDESTQADMLARRYFRWASPATFDGFVSWSGLGKRVARKAVERMELTTVTVDELEGDFLALADRLEPTESEEVFFLPPQDNLLTLRDHSTALVAPHHHERQMLTMTAKTKSMAEMTWSLQRPVVQHGEWIGLWDWDHDKGEVLFAGFDGLPAKTAVAADEVAATIGHRIASELDGNARSHAADSTKAQQKRVAEILKMLEEQLDTSLIPVG